MRDLQKCSSNQETLLPALDLPHTSNGHRRLHFRLPGSLLSQALRFRRSGHKQVASRSFWTEHPLSMTAKELTHPGQAALLWLNFNPQNDVAVLLGFACRQTHHEALFPEPFWSGRAEQHPAAVAPYSPSFPSPIGFSSSSRNQ